ncbi:DUF885 domain-containing protein [Lachnospiraceae bacterium 64-25]
MENETKKRPSAWMAVIIAVVAICLTICGVMAIIGILIDNRQDDPEAFDACMDEMFKELVVQNTINLHYTLAYPENYGITDYPVTLGDVSVENLQRSADELKEMEEVIHSFYEADLSPEQELTYTILMDYIETEKSVAHLEFYDELLEPTYGYQAELPIILAEYTFRKEQDIEDYLTLLLQMDEYYAQIIAYEEKKAEAGLFMSDDAADMVIEQCEEFIQEPENNYMIEVFNDKIDSFEGLSEEEREEYKERHDEIVTTEVVDAYQTLIDGMRALKGSGTNELGLCYYEYGKEYYEYLIHSEVGADDSVKRLEKKIERYIDDFLQDLYDAAIESPEVYEEIMNFSLPDMEPEEGLQDLLIKMEEDFPEPPQVDFTVKYVHPSMQDHLSPAFYLTTPIDDIKNNSIYINGKYTKNGAEDSGDLYTTLAHEGYPGHLYQNAYTLSCDLPLIRNLISYKGYTEGWATYVEFEYGYPYAAEDHSETAVDLYARNSAVSLALYAYIDLGIHYEGWDKEDVKEVLSMFMDVDQETLDGVYEAVLYDPAGYLSYFVGYLEFLELREEAMEELGEDFDIKEFHDFILRTGPAPFYIIESRMGMWIAEQ